MEKYDVIIPLYNGEKWIDEAIHSVLNQSCKPQKIIVVNDASTDSSVECVSRFSEVKLFHNPNPGSPARAKNYGLKQTTAPLVAFLDQDDVWHPCHMKLLNEILMDYPEIPAAASFFEIFHDDSQPKFDLRDRKIEMFDPWDFYPFAEFMEPSVILFRRWVFDRFAWSDQVRGFADRCLWLQLSVHHSLIRLHARSVAKRTHFDCQYRLMFRDPITNLRDWAKVSDGLLLYRLKYIEEAKDKQRLQGRALIIHHLGNILQSLIEGNTKLLQSQARKLASILDGEKQHIQEQTFKTLFLTFLGESIIASKPPLFVCLLNVFLLGANHIGLVKWNLVHSSIFHLVQFYNLS